MNGIDYKDKIRKLLSLAQSDNENEAKAALLKAKELMAEHKLTEADVEELRAKNVLDIPTSVEFTMQSEPWVIKLVTVISENYCCKWYRSRKWNARKGSIYLIGLEGDAEICKMVFEYAVECVRAQNRKRSREMKTVGYSPESRRSVSIGYGEGIAAGIEITYREQQEQHHEWALVLATHVEVSDYERKKSLRCMRYASVIINSDAYHEGIEDGRKFNPHTRVDGTVAVSGCIA